jgi:hypothetical protein
MIVVQCVLTDGKGRIVAWLDRHPHLDVGKFVTLKDYEDPDKKWEVVSMGSEQDKSKLKRSHKWFENDFVRDGDSFRNAR